MKAIPHKNTQVWLDHKAWATLLPVPPGGSLRLPVLPRRRPLRAFQRWRAAGTTCLPDYTKITDALRRDTYQEMQRQVSWPRTSETLLRPPVRSCDQSE